MPGLAFVLERSSLVISTSGTCHPVASSVVYQRLPSTSEKGEVITPQTPSTSPTAAPTTAPTMFTIQSRIPTTRLAISASTNQIPNQTPQIAQKMPERIRPIPQPAHAPRDVALAAGLVEPFREVLDPVAGRAVRELRPVARSVGLLDDVGAIRLEVLQAGVV